MRTLCLYKDVDTKKLLEYPSRLPIYHSGDVRMTWVSFWKSVALLQFGTTLVFGVPLLWMNENQPDANVRKFQAILVGVLGTIPTLTLAYVTAPFVHQVFLQIPEYARRSRPDLMQFVRTLKANPRTTTSTKLEFETLRIFPFRKTTAAFLHELRVLPSKRMRLANIELPKTAAWAKRQRAKGIFQRMFEVMKEPRFKFYVKEGRQYTMKTGVPGVWEEVVKRIQEQTLAETGAVEGAKRGLRKPTVLGKPVTPAVGGELRERLKRQTLRPPR